MTRPLVIGEAADPHVAAVLAATRREPHVLDAASLEASPFSLVSQRIREVGRVDLATSDRTPGLRRGWLRRIAPANWMTGVLAESRASAEKSAWLALLATVIHDRSITWLTPVEAFARAENKLVVNAAAEELGIAVPATVVASKRSTILDSLGQEVVLKPLGAGHYIERDSAVSVFSRRVLVEDIDERELAGAPFIAQEVLSALRHFRVVTVRDEVWGAALDGRTAPLDWRQDPASHHSFEAVPLETSLRRSALTISESLGLGYSSQDWIETSDGFYLLDINPAGQWLFLPEATAGAATAAIASWLDG